MSRITQDLAFQIAVKMTEAKKKEIDLLNEQIKKLATDFAESKVPSEIKKCFKKLGAWMQKSNYIQFCGNGFNYDGFSLNHDVPNNGHNRHTPDDETAKKMKLLCNERYKKGEVRDQLIREIKTALVTLRTYNNVEKNFNEAFKHLPKNQTTALVPNIDSIRKKL